KARDDNQNSFLDLLGDDDDTFNQRKVEYPNEPDWDKLQSLKSEKETTGFYLTGHPLDDFRLEMDNFCSTTLDKVGEEIWQNRDLSVAGIVTKFQERYAKNGNPFCIFTVEDYGGSLEIALFGDDYVKHGPYIKQDHFLFIRGRMQPSWRNQGQFEFKATQVQLLPEVREKLCKQLSIELNMKLVSRELVNELNNIVAANPGRCDLLVTLKDVDSTVDVTLFSRKVKVAVTNELLGSLEGLVGKKSFRLN
ncbi:MAG: DNA polymerase III subunit alpha, partial [Sphingobacteriaceae bacterium]|nr:DNA polymerase III subunit alpha [Cytophagaceae bacterium]